MKFPCGCCEVRVTRTRDDWGVLRVQIDYDGQTFNGWKALSESIGLRAASAAQNRVQRKTCLRAEVGELRSSQARARRPQPKPKKTPLYVAMRKFLYELPAPRQV